MAFGIQDFESITAYFEDRKTATTEAKHLSLARYYRNHLENLAAGVPRSLLAITINLETALAVSHPGYFYENLANMGKDLKDLPVSNMEVASDSTSTAVDASSATHADDAVVLRPDYTPDSALAPLIPAVDTKALSDSHVAMESVLNEDLVTPALNNETPPGTPPSQGVRDTTLESSGISNEQSPISAPTKAVPTQKLSKSQRRKKKYKTPAPPPAPPASNSTAPQSVTRPHAVTNSRMRIKVRWAPTDFNELRNSSTKMYERLAPIFPCFNDDHT